MEYTEYTSFYKRSFKQYVYTEDFQLFAVLCPWLWPLHRLEHFYQACGRKLLVITLGLAYVSSKLPTVSKAVHDKRTEILTRYVALRKSDAASCYPSSNRKLRTFCPVGHASQIFVLTLVSGLIFLFISVAMNVTLRLFLLGVLDESLCTTSERTTSGEQLEGTVVTVLFSLLSSSSKARMSQMI